MAAEGAESDKRLSGAVCIYGDLWKPRGSDADAWYAGITRKGGRKSCS